MWVGREKVRGRAAGTYQEIMLCIFEHHVHRLFLENDLDEPGEVFTRPGVGIPVVVVRVVDGPRRLIAPMSVRPRQRFVVLRLAVPRIRPQLLLHPVLLLLPRADLPLPPPAAQEHAAAQLPIQANLPNGTLREAGITDDIAFLVRLELLDRHHGGHIRRLLCPCPCPCPCARPRDRLVHLAVRARTDKPDDGVPLQDARAGGVAACAVGDHRVRERGRQVAGRGEGHGGGRMGRGGVEGQGGREGLR